jgi:hypothetical protein
MPTLKTILLALTFGLALLGAAPDTAQAAPPRDVTYSYSYIPLVDANGESGNYDFAGIVRYNKDGTAYTQCSYARRTPGTFTRTPVGSHRVEYAIVDTSYEGVKQFCMESFANRNNPI